MTPWATAEVRRLVSFYCLADGCCLAGILVGRSDPPSGRNTIESYLGCGARGPDMVSPFRGKTGISCQSFASNHVRRLCDQR